MDESGPQPSDPSSTSDLLNREAAQSPDAPRREPGAPAGDPQARDALRRAPAISPDEVPLPALRSETVEQANLAPAANGIAIVRPLATPGAEPTAAPAAALTPVEVPTPADAAAHEPSAGGRAPGSEADERLAQENARRLESGIESLRAVYDEGGPRRFQVFFEQERSLLALFKSLRPLAAADRHRLWSTFKQAGVEVRRAQQEEWESRRYRSIEARESIEETLRKAESLIQGDAGPSDFRRADSMLNEIRSLLGGGAPGAPGDVLIGPDRRACWDRWRQARDALREGRGGRQEQDHARLAAQTAEAGELARTGDPFQAIQRVKELQAQLGRALLRRGQFEEVRKRLSEAWLAAQERIAGMRQERSRHRAEWRERMEGHLARWRETIEHKRSQREHLVLQVAKLEDMEKNARSEEFAVQVRGWRDETTEKLRRTEALIAELEERVRDAARKVSGRGGGRRPGESHGGTGELMAPGEHGGTAGDAPPEAGGSGTAGGVPPEAGGSGASADAPTDEGPVGD